MSIIRVSHDKDKPYVMMNRQSMQDNCLTFEAKGLWAYLISLPDNWQISVSHLSHFYKGKKKRGQGEKAVYAMLAELEEEGYLTSSVTRENGRYTGRDYTIYETRQKAEKADSEKRPPILSKPPLKTEKAEKTPNALLVGPAIARSVNQRQTISNDRKELFKKNDIIDSEEQSQESENAEQANAEHYRFSSEGESIVFFDKETLFDPETYLLPDGSKLSPRMINSLKKYTSEQRFKLILNIRYFEECVAKGAKPLSSNYEKMLQGYITGDYASKENVIAENRNVAIVMKELYKIRGLSIKKTVVMLKRGLSEPPESISLSLPPETFVSIIKSYHEKYKDQ